MSGGGDEERLSSQTNQQITDPQTISPQIHKNSQIHQWQNLQNTMSNSLESTITTQPTNNSFHALGVHHDAKNDSSQTSGAINSIQQASTMNVEAMQRYISKQQTILSASVKANTQIHIQNQSSLNSQNQSGHIRPPQRIAIQNTAQSNNQSQFQGQKGYQSHQVNQGQRKSILAPRSIRPPNTLVPRLKLGYTNLMTPTSPKEKRRQRFIDQGANSDDEELNFDSDSFDDNDEDEERGLRSSKRMRNSNRLAEQVSSSQSGQKYEKLSDGKFIDPPEFQVNATQSIKSTRHDYEKINLYRLESLASIQELLIPISLEFDIVGHKIIDQFTWNLNDKFAEYLCEDLDLNLQVYIPTISRAIKSQIQEYRKFFQYADRPVPSDTRIIIRIDLKVGKVHLRDRFEWDLNSQLVPEQFAAMLASDLSLGGEFVPLIAFSIREQIYKYRIQGDFEPTFAIERPWRAEEEARSWSPFVDVGDPLEDSELGIEQDRKQRLLRRQLKVSSGQKRRELYDDQFVQVGVSPHILALPEDVRMVWRCGQCLIPAAKTMGIKDGPGGCSSLCLICGSYFETDGILPIHRLHLFK